MVLSSKIKRQAKIVDLPTQSRFKKKKKRKFKLKGPGIVLLLVISFASYSFGTQIVEAYNVQREIVKIQQEMGELELKNENLKKRLTRLQSEAWVERVAREKLGLVKPGEKLILHAKPEEMTTISESQRENIEVH